MKIKVEIQMGNAAMQTGEDVADLLRRTADRFSGDPVLGDEIGLYDLNGNRVGSLKVTR